MLLDTSGLLALLSVREQDHVRAKDLFTKRTVKIFYAPSMKSGGSR